MTLLDASIEDARLCFLIDGRAYVVGRGEAEGCDVTLRVNAPQCFARVLTAGNLGLGEAYMAREIEIEEGTLHDFLTILLRNRLDRKLRARPLMAARILLMRWADALRGKAHNVQRHYDIGDDLFDSFLDETLTYSCGYARHPDDDVEELQLNKLDRICRKLRLAPGHRLLDIGCGFGGLLIHAARHFGVTGTGITISRRHYERGNQRIAEAGLADRLHIDYADFAEVDETFDRVVSVGMMEHVPRSQYRAYVRKIAEVLAPQGLGLIHTIGANAAKNWHDPFVQKYIFPHSGQPRLSEIAVQLERHGLAIHDVENMARHYGYTALRWLERFRANRHRLDPARYDDAFVRMWEYYFCCGIAAAFYSDGALYQVLFAKDYAVPMPLQRV